MQYQKEEVRAKILEAALDEFERCGYTGAKMRRIAHGAGVAIGNLYRYFESKESIFDEIVKIGTTSISTLIFDSYRFDKENRGDVKLLAAHIAEGIMSAYTKFGRQLMIIIDKSEGSKHQDFLAILCDMAARRIKEELVVRMEDIDDEFIALISWGFIEGLIRIFRNCQDAERREALINKLLVFYFFEGFESRL